MEGGDADGWRLETARLVLRRFTLADAPFIQEVVNEPGWLRYIGDRMVHSPDDARAYLERALLAQYARLGFGFYRVELRATGEVVGLCGVVRRPGLDDADIGFALLERHEGHGYAREAAERVVRHAAEDLGLTRLTAIVQPDNARSIALLAKLGMRYERAHRPKDEDAELCLYAMELRPRTPAPTEGS